MDTRGSPGRVPIQTDAIPRGAAGVVANIGAATFCGCRGFGGEFASGEFRSGPADSAGLRRGCDIDGAASVESLLRLIPSPEEQREVRQVLERLHPADARTFLKDLLPDDFEYSDYSGYGDYD